MGLCVMVSDDAKAVGAGLLVLGLIHGALAWGTAGIMKEKGSSETPGRKGR